MLTGNLRLRYIYHGDFRRSEQTLLDDALQEAKGYGVELPDLKAGDCIMLLSANGKLVRFVFGFSEAKTLDKTGATDGRRSRVLPSLQYRITDHGTFNEYMIANYAAALGITLDRIKRLEDHLSKRQQ